METNKVIEKAVVEAVKDGATTITILTGTASNPLTVNNPNPVKLTGTIDAPKRFIEVREFDRKASHALVSLSRGEIKLVVNEQSTDDLYTVTGRVAISKQFAELGINTDKYYEPEDLAKKLKLKRSMFANKLDHAKTIASLRNIKAKVNQDIEKAKDDKGNVTDAMRQSVESNMPDSITVKIPLIEGQEPVKIELFIVMEVEAGKIICTLESIDGAEGIDEFREKAVLEQVEAIKDRTTVIFE